MALKLFLPLLLLISPAISAPKSPAFYTAFEEAADLPCVKELLPCRPFLQAAKPPPEQCCAPLLSAIHREAACLCTVFYSDPILSALNLTQEEALRLPRSCGGHVPELGTCDDGGGRGGWPAAAPAIQAASPVKLSPSSSGPFSSKPNTGNIIKTAGFATVIGGTAFATILLFM